jgi:hypothetical protein
MKAMRTGSTLLLAGLLATVLATGCGGRRLDRTDPEAVAQAFFKAVVERDEAAAAMLVHPDARESFPDVAELMTAGLTEGTVIEVVEIKAGDSPSAVSVYCRLRTPEGTVTVIGTQLHQTDGEWAVKP